MSKLKSPLTNTSNSSGSQTPGLCSGSAKKSTICVTVFMSKLVDRGTPYFFGSCMDFSHILTMWTWDLVCTLACSGFPSKEARTCPEVAMVCPAGPAVYASRGPGGQGKPQTHQFCRVETDELKGSQITPSQYMLTCLPQTACRYSLERNTRILIWGFLKIHWGFSEKGLSLKKTTTKHQASVLLKVLGGRVVTISKRMDLASWATPMTRPFWAAASSSWQTTSEQ